MRVRVFVLLAIVLSVISSSCVIDKVESINFASLKQSTNTNTNSNTNSNSNSDVVLQPNENRNVNVETAAADHQKNLIVQKQTATEGCAESEIRNFETTPNALTRYDNVEFLDRHYITCSSVSGALVSFHLKRWSDEFVQYQFSCLNNIVINGVTIEQKTTPVNDAKSVVYLDRHDIDCDNRPLTAFRLKSYEKEDYSRVMYYQYSCAQTSVDPSTIVKSRTNPTEFQDDVKHTIFMDRQTVSCSHLSNKHVLTRVKFQRDNDDNAHFEYTCAVPDSCMPKSHW